MGFLDAFRKPRMNQEKFDWFLKEIFRSLQEESIVSVAQLWKKYQPDSVGRETGYMDSKIFNIDANILWWSEMSLEFNEALMTLVKRQEIYMFPVDTDVFQIFSGDFFTYPELPVMPGLVEYVDPKKTYWMPICLSTDKSIHDKQWTTPHNTDYRGEKMHLRMVYPDGHTEDING